MNKDIDIVIEKIEEALVDSDLSKYTAIGVLETVKELLFEDARVEAREQVEKEINSGWN